MDVQLLSVPYDSGVWGARMGGGPARLLEAGIATALEIGGHTVRQEEVSVEPAPVPAEVEATFRLLSRLSRRIGAAVADGRTPVVLAGRAPAPSARSPVSAVPASPSCGSMPTPTSTPPTRPPAASWTAWHWRS